MARSACQIRSTKACMRMMMIIRQQATHLGRWQCLTAHAWLLCMRRSNVKSGDGQRARRAGVQVLLPGAGGFLPWL
jgi:hypothetical protein